MRSDQRTDMSLMSFGGKTNVVLELGKRLIQPEEEWKDKCAAFTELRQAIVKSFVMQSDLSNVQETAAAEDVASLFTPENVQALTQPFRVTLTDLRSTVVKEACTTLSLLAQKLGPLRCKILVRDVFPTLLDARGGSNKVNTAAIHNCIETIVTAAPSRFVLVPVLQVLNSSKNREVRESCVHYTYLALEDWNIAVLERYRLPLQSAIAAALSDASSKGREKARDCYWKYISIWPDEAERITDLLAEGVKKHLKRSRDKNGFGSSHQPAKRIHLATITNMVSSKSAPQNRFTGNDAANSTLHVKQTSKQRTTSRTGTTLRACSTKKSTLSEKLSVQALLHNKGCTTATAIPSRIPSTPISALKNPRQGDTPSRLLTPCAIQLPATVPALIRQNTPTHYEGKVARLENDNALLIKQMETKVHDLEQLHRRIQKIEDEKQQSELKHKAAMAATMDAHARDTATQHKLQYSLAEQIATQEEELERLQNWLRSSTFPIQLPPATMKHVKTKMLLMPEQLQGTTAEIKPTDTKAYNTMNAPGKPARDGHLTKQSTQSEKLQPKQYAAIAATEDEKRIVAIELSALQSGQSEALTRCEEKDERVDQLERDVLLLSEQLQAAATTKVEVSNADACNEMEALRSEKSVLEERLLVQNTQLEELQAKQYAAVAAIEDEKRMLAIELSALQSGQSEALTRCEEKDERVAQLERDVLLLSEQLQAATAKVEASNADACNEVEALRSEKSVLKERLLAQSMELKELLSLSEQLKAGIANSEASNSNDCEGMEVVRSEDCVQKKSLLALCTHLQDFLAKQCNAVAVIEEEKRMLAIEVCTLKSVQSEVKAKCAAFESRYNTCDDFRQNSANFRIPLSLVNARDRLKFEAEERRMNETNVIKRKLRRQNRQQQKYNNV